MSLPESNPKDADETKVEPEQNLSARLGAESALSEFKHKMVDHLTDEQAKDAYARLVVGRGFDRPRPTPTPVMTIHSAMVSGTSNAEAGKAAEAAPADAKPVVPKGAGLTGLLLELTSRLRKRD